MRNKHSLGSDAREDDPDSHGSNGTSEVCLRQGIRELVNRLEVQLCELTEPIRANGHAATSLVLMGRPGAASEQTVRYSIRARSQRDRFFLKGLFADPAWDMLLDLYVSEISGQKVSVSSLCIASNVPSTTALRWIASLDCEGLVERSSDSRDRRRYFISLTNKGRCAMDAYFASLSAVPASNDCCAGLNSDR